MANDTSYLNNTHINCSGVTVNATTSPSEEYYNLKVLEVSDGIDSAGRFKWELVLCNLLSWTVCCIIIIKGIKSLGKAIYVFTILPYILLTVLLVRGVTLEGAQIGIDFYITPNLDMLSKAEVWGDAAVQIFFSTSTCSGALIAMASYNKFNNNTMRDAVLIPIINCLTSFFAGFAIFSVLGFMATAKGVSVEDVTTQGPGLVFIVYPDALSKMPIPPLWSVLFFIMLTTLGWSSMISGVESVLTAIIDVFPAVVEGKRNYVFRFSACMIGFLLGLPQVTQGGSYLLGLMDNFVGGFPLLIIGLFELTAVMFVYGVNNFRKDVEMMLGAYMNIVTRLVFYYILACWGVISPVLLVIAIVFKSIQYEPITGPGYPEWAEVLGWLVVAATVIAIPVWFIGFTCYKGGVVTACRESNWGPMLEENRTGKYSSSSIGLTSDGQINNFGIANASYTPYEETKSHF